MTVTIDNSDPSIAIFDDLVTKAMKGGLDRRAAVAAVAIKHPRVHRAFVIATNRDANQSMLENIRRRK